MSQGHRIAVASIFTECNHFVNGLMDLGWFERCELRRGNEILSTEGGVVGGMLRCLRERSAEVAPLVVASTVPGPALSFNCYLQLKEDLIERLLNALPVDGVLLALH